MNGTIDISGSVSHLTPLSKPYLKNNVQHYTGEVTMKINNSFEDFSYHCYHHGYMGGENRMTFSSLCPELGGVSISRIITADSNNTSSTSTTISYSESSSGSSGSSSGTSGSSGTSSESSGTSSESSSGSSGSSSSSSGSSSGSSGYSYY